MWTAQATRGTSRSAPKAGASLALLLGCGAQPLPTIVWSGEHLNVGADAELDEVCGGTFGYLDRYVGALKKRLGNSSEYTVDYYWVPDGAEPFCSNERGVVGCISEGNVFSEEVALEHELVHACNLEHGYSHPLLEEGMAVFWGDDVVLPEDPRSLEAALDDTASRGVLSREHYPTAGLLMSVLVRDLGERDSLELARSVGFEDPESHVNIALEDAYGVPFSEFASSFEDEERCRQHRFRDAGPSCEAAAKLSCTDPLIPMSARIELECGSSEIIGPDFEEIWTAVTFNVPQSEQATRSFWIRVTAADTGEFPAWATVRLERCGSGCGRFVEEVSELAMVELLPGAYRLRFSRRIDEDAPAPAVLDVQLLEAVDPEDSSCVANPG